MKNLNQYIKESILDDEDDLVDNDIIYFPKDKNELIKIKMEAMKLEKESDEVAVIFNNNSGGHAAKNAKELQELLGLEFEGLHPQQLDLF